MVKLSQTMLMSFHACLAYQAHEEYLILLITLSYQSHSLISKGEVRGEVGERRILFYL